MSGYTTSKDNLSPAILPFDSTEAVGAEFECNRFS
jgi:hypothetical protein